MTIFVNINYRYSHYLINDMKCFYNKQVVFITKMISLILNIVNY